MGSHGQIRSEQSQVSDTKILRSRSAIEADQDEARFGVALGKVARHKPAIREDGAPDGKAKRREEKSEDR
jgi:hypothetical protein